MIDRARLVNDLASRLDHASELTYTAEYQLPAEAGTPGAHEVLGEASPQPVAGA